MPTTFTYVLVPCDDSEPTELTATTEKFGDQLADILKPRFGGGSIKNAEGLRAEYGSAVDEKMEQLNIVAAQGSVEIFALVRPSAQTVPVAHAGTYLYFDEMGVLKGLPVNRRAANIAASCGLDVESPFLGDVYIGRVAVQPNPSRNASFALAELDSSSPWLRSAPSENAQYQMAMAEYEKAAKAATAEAKGRATDAPAAAASSSEPPAPGSHKWAQTSDDLEVTVAVPAETAKRDVKVVVSAKKLSVQIKGAALVELALYAAVRPDEMTWTLDAAKAQLAVMVEKADAVSWPRLEAATDGQIL